MAGPLSVLNKSAYGTRAEQKAAVADVTTKLADKRAELAALLACVNGEQTDCMKCIRAQWCERRQRKVDTNGIVD